MFQARTPLMELAAVAVLVALAFALIAFLCSTAQASYPNPDVPADVSPPPGGGSWEQNKDDVYPPPPPPPPGGGSWGQGGEGACPPPSPAPPGGGSWGQGGEGACPPPSPPPPGGGSWNHGDSIETDPGGDGDGDSGDSDSRDAKQALEPGGGGNVKNGVKVLAVKGSAQKMIMVAGKPKWVAIKPGDVLGKYSIVRTGLRSGVTLQFADQSAAKIGSATKMGVASLGNGHSQPAARLDVKYGVVRVQRHSKLAQVPSGPQMVLRQTSAIAVKVKAKTARLARPQRALQVSNVQMVNRTHLARLVRPNRISQVSVSKIAKHAVAPAAVTAQPSSKPSIAPTLQTTISAAQMRPLAALGR